MWSVQEVSPLTPTPPTLLPPVVYNASPPPNTLTPPTRSPTSGSFAAPNAFACPWYAGPASTGLLCWRPYKLPPGCTAEYRFAVDNASPVGNRLVAGVAPL